WMQAGAERLLGRLALAAGAATDAERYVHHALGRLAAKGFAIDIPECLDVLAAVAATQDSDEEAARLLGAAAAARARLGTVRFPPRARILGRCPAHHPGNARRRRLPRRIHRRCSAEHRRGGLLRPPGSRRAKTALTRLGQPDPD
ncbi:MAG: hypothetical protein ABR528_13675, partial [Pseudonocardiaceae bacterium]